jgi:hypothetical protein
MPEAPGSFWKPVIEDAVNNTNDLAGKGIVKAVGLPEIFTQDQGEQKLAQVTDSDHRQLPQKEPGGSPVIRRAHNNIQVREFLFKPDERALRPVVKLGVAANHCGKPCSAPEDHDPRVSAFQPADLVCQTRDRFFMGPSRNTPVDNRFQELVNVSGDL